MDCKGCADVPARPCAPGRSADTQPHNTTDAQVAHGADAKKGTVTYKDGQTDRTASSPFSQEADAICQQPEQARSVFGVEAKGREQLGKEFADGTDLCLLSRSRTADSSLLATCNSSTDHREAMDMDKSKPSGQVQPSETSQQSWPENKEVFGQSFEDSVATVSDSNSRQITHTVHDPASKYDMQNAEWDCQSADGERDKGEQNAPTAAVEACEKPSETSEKKCEHGELCPCPERFSVSGESDTEKPHTQPDKCWTRKCQSTGNGDGVSHNAGNLNDRDDGPSDRDCYLNEMSSQKDKTDWASDTKVHCYSFQNLEPSLSLQNSLTSQNNTAPSVTITQNSLGVLDQASPVSMENSNVDLERQECCSGSTMTTVSVESSEITQHILKAEQANENTGRTEAETDTSVLANKELFSDHVGSGQSIFDPSAEKSVLDRIDLFNQEEVASKPVEGEAESDYGYMVISGENKQANQAHNFFSSVCGQKVKESSGILEESASGKELENHLLSSPLCTNSGSQLVQIIPGSELHPKTAPTEETGIETPSNQGFPITKMETKDDDDHLGILKETQGKGSDLHKGLCFAEHLDSDAQGHTATIYCVEETLSSTASFEARSTLINDSEEMTVKRQAQMATCSVGEALSGESSAGLPLGEALCVSVEGRSSSDDSHLMIREGPEFTIPSEVLSDGKSRVCPAVPITLRSEMEPIKKEEGFKPVMLQMAECKTEGFEHPSALSDPKPVVLNLGDTSLLKNPCTLGEVSKNLEVVHGTCTQSSNSACVSGSVSVECLSKAVSSTDLVPTSMLLHAGPPNSQPSSCVSDSLSTLISEPMQDDPCLSTSFPLMNPQSSFDEALAEMKLSTANTHQAPQNLLTPAVSPTALDSFQSPLYHSLSDQISVDQPSQDSDLSQLPTEILQSEHSEWSTVSQLSKADIRSSPPERHSTPSGDSSDSDVDISRKSQPSSSGFALSTSTQNKTSRGRPHLDKAFTPLRGPHGKFISTASRSPGGLSQPDLIQRHRTERHTDMAELAKHEAEIEHRTLALKREGFWSLKRLSRVAEPCRPKVQWDYLCEEMQWLSADFAQERRWKRGVARKVVRMVMRYHEEQRQKEEKTKREEQAKLRRVASSIAKEVRAFWSSVEKVVQFKQQSRLEEKRKKALDLQLDFIVGQTERYSDLLSQSLGDVSVSVAKSATAASSVECAGAAPRGSQQFADEDDGDFEPLCEEDDDEETIEVEEQQEGNDAETQKREIELLRHEGTLPLDELLSTLVQSQDSPSEEECSDDSSSAVEEEDEEFAANEEDAEDEEETIAAQEVVEGNADHSEELNDLAREGSMSIEELLEKYKGAYADSELASVSASNASCDEDSEFSEEGEEEEEEESGDPDSEAESSRTSDSSTVLESGGGDDDDEGGEGMEVLLKDGDHSPPGSASSRPKKEISHIAATAQSLQPKGYTLATAQVKTPIPFLLHGLLREYQHIGLDWLVTMYEKKLNGILADEMGLGKTIQTIALLAHLACEKGNWGPHLIIVPTSVMLNWEMEFKRWCPSFKILTYYGSQKERRLKRQGWTKPNAFHVCITSYKLVLQDHQAFRRKSWRYLILDEAQNIKNFKSQRWQSLLNFNSQRRLLLTGTPLQNSLMELWSLMHFLMPHVFQSHREFKEWFSNPLTGMIEGSQEYNEGLVKRLHKVLRPFLLRRIKVDVEKQMPKKYEHVVRCRLSKRQRFLYDDFMAQASTRETLASGHFMSVINILMQLRKVCNHPDLFDPRPIHSPFITAAIVFTTASLVLRALDTSPFECCDLSMFDLVGLEGHVSRYQADVFLPRRKVTRQMVQEIMDSPDPPPRPKPVRMKVNRMFQPLPRTEGRTVVLVNNPRLPSPAPAPAPVPRPPLVVESASPISPATSVHSASHVTMCSVTAALQKAPMCASAGGAADRPGTPHPVLTVRPPLASGASSLSGVTAAPSSTGAVTQRVLLSPDMQARLPSGEVVSIAQLASLAGRPLSSCQGSKPVTFQLQGNKLTLSGAQLHQVTMAQPRPIQGNVVHLVSSGGQHHLISQAAQVAVIQTVSQGGGGTVNTHPTTAPPGHSGLTLPLSTAEVPSSMVASPGIVKIVMRPTAGKDLGGVSARAVPPAPCGIPTPTPVSTHINASPSLRVPLPAQPAHRLSVPVSACSAASPASSPANPQLPRPLLKVLPGSSSASEQARVTAPPSREDGGETVAVRMAPTPGVGSVGSAHVGVRPRAQPPPPPRSVFYMSWLAEQRKSQCQERIARILRVNEHHCSAKPVYGREVLDMLTFLPLSLPAPALTAPGDWPQAGHTHCLHAQLDHPKAYWEQIRGLRDAIHTTEERLHLLADVVDRFIFVIPSVEAPPISMHVCHPPPSLSHQQALFSSALSSKVAHKLRCLHRIQCNMRTHFPDLRLIQYDCGKLQTLHTLLRRLKSGGHRVLIFTQMTRMLDILEQFLNYHGHIYLRLDGSTRVEQRQALMERFNADRRIFCFILSTRSGGVGVNLTGADTVVFYDSDWNPTMDAQAQDRCHRIGQTRDVHIYRLISERTVEENILKKANQKRMLGDMAIEGGNFTTAFFKQQTIRELFDVSEGEKREAEVSLPSQQEEDDALSKQHTIILEQALCRAEDEEDIVAASQAKAEQVAELAEFNESIPLEESSEGMGRDQEEEEMSKAEQEIAALVEQLTPIERYAMNFLEASLEDICKEELKQAEEQVEAARKDLDQAKEEVMKLPQSSDIEEEELCPLVVSEDPVHATSNRRGRKYKEKGAPSTRLSERLRGPTVTSEVELDSAVSHTVTEQYKDKGSESQYLEQNVSSVSLAPQQCSENTVACYSKLDGTLSATTLKIVVESNDGVLQTKEVKDLPVTPLTSSGIQFQNTETQTQLLPATTRVMDTVNSGMVCSARLSSELLSGDQMNISYSPKSLAMHSTAPNSTDTKTQIAQTPSTSFSISEANSKDQSPSDYDGISKHSDSQKCFEVKECKSKEAQALSTSSDMSNIHNTQQDLTQIQDEGATKSEDKDRQKSLKHAPQPHVGSPLPRSPRKRQSADGEVLSSHIDDALSAKVLRKLPGRLVTVVEDKEPRRKKRSTGGGQQDGKSQELGELEQDTEVSGGAAIEIQVQPGVTVNEIKTATRTSPAHHTQDFSVSPSRAITHYSPVHSSPDMPVLRNLPVRRRLETESRLAAQLGEQNSGRGRGRGERRSSLSPNFHRKLDSKGEGCGETLTSLESSTFMTPKVNTTPPGKRKRGRPPKTPPRVIGSPKDQASPSHTVGSETEVVGRSPSPSPSPKRKRGRPRKDLKTSESDSSCVSPGTLIASPSNLEVDQNSDSFAVGNVQHISLTSLSHLAPSSNKYPLETNSAANFSLAVNTSPSSYPDQTFVHASQLSPAPQSNQIYDPIMCNSVQPCTENEHGGAEVEENEEFKNGNRTVNSTFSEEREGDQENSSKDVHECEEKCQEDEDAEDYCTSQPKKRRVAACLSGDQGSSDKSSSLVNEVTERIVHDERHEESRGRTRVNKHTVPKRPEGRRRSSQESGCSSSPSSVSSRSTSTYSTLSKKDDTMGGSAKRKDKADPDDKEKNTEKETPKQCPSNRSDSTCTTSLVPEQCSFSSSSSDSDDSGEGSKEQRLTRAAQRRLESGQCKELKGDVAAKRRGRKTVRSPCNESQLTSSTTTRAQGQSSNEVPVRITRKSSGPPLTPESRQPSNTILFSSPTIVTDVLGKRCSALNAAAKLLAMRSKGGNSGSSIVFSVGKESHKGGRAIRQHNPFVSSDRSNKTEGKGLHDVWAKSEDGRQDSAHSSPSASRSTRQRPGYLMPPLQSESKRNRTIKKRTEGKGEDSRSPRAQSASSSLSSEQGEGSGRSRSSSSSSSQRTHSLGSQRHQDRGSRALEPSAGSTDGAPDRLLRSVAALAAAQARTPASNTRSSSIHHHRQHPHAQRGKT